MRNSYLIALSIMILISISHFYGAEKTLAEVITINTLVGSFWIVSAIETGKIDD